MRHLEMMPEFMARRKWFFKRKANIKSQEIFTERDSRIWNPSFNVNYRLLDIKEYNILRNMFYKCEVFNWGFIYDFLFAIIKRTIKEENHELRKKISLKKAKFADFPYCHDG